MTEKKKFSTRIDVEEGRRAKLIDDLNITLATTLDLATQVKQAHWNIKGAQFVARHELFDQLALHLRDWSDTIAERATTLGGYATGTARQAAKLSKIPEYDLEAVGGRSHITALADRYGSYCKLIRNKLGESGDDPVTEDIYTEILRGAEMDLWFLEAHLQEK